MFLIMKKVSKKFDFISISIAVVSIVIIINVILFAGHNTFSTLLAAEGEKVIICSELKEYQGDLQEDIILLKEERADKEAYLADLDKRFEELESQYKELLEQKKRISDELDSINTVKN